MSTGREKHPPVVLFIGADTGVKSVEHRKAPKLRPNGKTAKNGVSGSKTAFIFGRSAVFLGCGMGKYGVLFSIDK
jgi:cytochrome c biogenesis protein CcdA